MKISDLARRAGVGVETIRFYERKGLVPRPQRPATGYRDYGDESTRRVRFIRRAQELGFSLAEVRQLMALRADPRVMCDDVRATAHARIAGIDAKIDALQRMRTALQLLALRCPGEGPTDECPILDSIDDEEEVQRRK